jgi:hypothetical protein
MSCLFIVPWSQLVIRLHVVMESFCLLLLAFWPEFIPAFCLYERAARNFVLLSVSFHIIS